MKRSRMIVIAVIGLVGSLAIASYLTTSIVWDGGFPSGEVRIDVRDRDGTPVKGAVLRVYRGGTRELTTNYPLENHTAGQGLVSDEHGRITAVRTSDRSQFGGHSWSLFWIIPMGARAPEFDCEITADGYKPLHFPVWNLFESAHRHYNDFPKTKLVLNGEEIELKVYEQTIILGK